MGELYPVETQGWAHATSDAFHMLADNKVVKPEWWNDEGLKALSARVLRAAPNMGWAILMRARVLSGSSEGTWEVGSRSAAELKEAAAHFQLAAALFDAPEVKDQFVSAADKCRSRA